MASTFSDAIYGQDKLYAGNSPALNLIYGGQQGYMPRMGLIKADGQTWGEWLNNAAYVRRNIIPVLLQAPRFFDLLPETQSWISLYKTLIETQPYSIDGLQSGLTVDTDEHAIGGAGEMQHEVVNVTRATSNITMVFREKMGMPINKFLNFIIRTAMMDPDTKKPNITRYISSIDDIGGMYTPDFYAGTVLYIEPDITHRVVVNAWLCTNMFPASDGEVSGKRDIHSPNELVEYSIEWKHITLNTDAVKRLASAILPNMTILDQLPDSDLILPASDIDPNVSAAPGGFNHDGSSV